LKANKPYLIKEENRQIPFQIIQDHSGTHIYSCYNLCLLKTISKLIKAKIDVLCIDTFLHDKDWTLLTTKAYLDAIANPKKNISEVIINEFTKYDHYLSQGFFELKKENLLYLSNELQLTWNND
jgi:putative protease